MIDKKTSFTKTPLRRVKDEDILPSLDEGLYNYSTMQRGYISAAMHIAKSRVIFPRE